MDKAKAQKAADFLEVDVNWIIRKIELFTDLERAVTFEQISTVCEKIPRDTELSRIANEKLVVAGQNMLRETNDFDEVIEFYRQTTRYTELETAALERAYELIEAIKQARTLYVCAPNDSDVSKKAQDKMSKLGHELLSKAITVNEVMEVHRQVIPGSVLEVDTLIKLTEFF